MLYHLIVFLVRVAFFFWYNIRVEGRENIPKNGNFIFASNHRSYADPVLVVICARGRFRFMAKSVRCAHPCTRRMSCGTWKG